MEKDQKIEIEKNNISEENLEDKSLKDNEELIETAQDAILMLTKKSVVVIEIVSKSKMRHDSYLFPV